MDIQEYLKHLSDKEKPVYTSVEIWSAAVMIGITSLGYCFIEEYQADCYQTKGDGFKFVFTHKDVIKNNDALIIRYDIGHRLEFAR